MALPRASIRPTTRLLNQSFKATRSKARTRSWQMVQRRTYADHGGHEEFKAGSDLPWAITSTVVTVPCIWYLWPPSKKKDEHGHGHDEHKSHDEGGGASSHDDGDHSSESEEGGKDDAVEQDEKEEEKKEENESEKGGEKGGEKSDEESKSENEGGQEDTPETSDDESGDVPHEKGGGGNVEGVRFKGPTKGGTKDGEQGDTRKHVPVAEGITKKRIESDYGIVQGAAQDDDATVQEPGNVQDKAAASKPAGSQTVQSGKQEGIANTDTKHSTDVTNDPEKSTKGEGTPETSKTKGTVDPFRPQV
ncbi:hypothetical protein MMC07_001171 [Pseudocyphellaria aurata]|nr:hypothetical protein [Pseudocyphellaria aurata]